MGFLSTPTRILDFVDSQILRNDDPEEPDLFSLDMAYAELARLEDIKKNIESTVDSGLDFASEKGEFLLSQISKLTAESESAADTQTGTILANSAESLVGEVSKKFQESVDSLINSASPIAKAGIHVAVGESKDKTARNVTKVLMRKLQINPMMVKDLSSLAFQVSSLKGTLTDAANYVLGRAAKGLGGLVSTVIGPKTKEGFQDPADS